MTSSDSEELLPEDLQAGDDNPLAKPLDPEDAPDVDLNEPSATYARQLDEEGESTEQSDSGDPSRGSDSSDRGESGTDPKSS